MADWIRRVLHHQGYTVHHIKNITDVGHMRQELLERGEDKVIAAALAEGRTPADIANYYTEAFLRDEARLNILPAERFPKATDHVPEMIELTQRLVERGHAYEVEGNVYFSVASFPSYGALSGNTQDDLLEGVRAEADPLKRDPSDFTLWKAAEPGRALKWSSPWGDGFPGWHIECSAMSMKYLGQHLDIHTGGVDNVFPHREGEIAQSEGATGEPFVGYWVHGQHLLADGAKMAKSSGNAYTVEDLVTHGFDPLAFRYLCLTAQYSSRLNFTFSALRAAQQALTRLRDRSWGWYLSAEQERGAPEALAHWRSAFWDKAANDLDMPGALVSLSAMVRSELPDPSKLQLLLEFDELLGLDMASVPEMYGVPASVHASLQQRHELRTQRQYVEADAIRKELREQHCVVEDHPAGTRARPMTGLERRTEQWRSVSSSHEVPSLLEASDTVDFSVVVVACNYQTDVQRCVESALRWSNRHTVEVVAVDNGSTDGTGEWLHEASARDPRIQVVHADHVIGDAAAKNIGLKRSQGWAVVVLDTSTEVTGDIYTPLTCHLEDPLVGVSGPFGLLTSDLRHFDEVDSVSEADAMQGYCFAFRRANLKDVGWMPEAFRFYRNLDIHYSFQFKDHDFRIHADPKLPIGRHTHRVWSEMSAEERDRLSAVNVRRFLKHFGDRTDLLVSARSG